MTDEELQQMKEKSRRYVLEPERITIRDFHLTMISHHAVRHIRFRDEKWTCTCAWYEKQGTCSHVMAATELFRMHFHFRT